MSLFAESAADDAALGPLKKVLLQTELYDGVLARLKALRKKYQEIRLAHTKAVEDGRINSDRSANEDLEDIRLQLNSMQKARQLLKEALKANAPNTRNTA